MGVCRSILGIAGATFTSSLNLTDSWLATIDGATNNRQFDVEVSLAQAQSPDDIKAALDDVEEVSEIETWTQNVVSEVATPSTARGDELLVANLNGVPPETTFVDYPILEGRCRGDDVDQ